MRARTRDVILGAIGIAALACYILACGPAFSPDDSRVLFPTNDPATGHAVMALYDRRARTTRPLLTLPVGSDDMPPAFAWTPDGTHAVALWSGAADVLHVAAVPLRAGAPPRLLTVTGFDDDAMMYVYWHPLLIGASLYVGGDGSVRRIDLLDGEVTAVSVEGKTRLAAAGERIFYARALPDADGAGGRVEIGQLDAHTLALSPRFVAAGVGGDVLAVSPDGARIAVDALDSDAAQILVFESGRLRQRLALGAAAPGLKIAGMPAWSRDGSRLYASYRQPLDDAHGRYGIIELPVDGSAPRLQPLLEAGGSDGFMPLDVSHDGRTLATVSTYLQTPAAELSAAKPRRLGPGDLALFLIDLAGPRHSITRVAIPPLPAPAASAAATQESPGGR